MRSTPTFERWSLFRTDIARVGQQNRFLLLPEACPDNRALVALDPGYQWSPKTPVRFTSGEYTELPGERDTPLHYYHPLDRARNVQIIADGFDTYTSDGTRRPQLLVIMDPGSVIRMEHQWFTPISEVRYHGGDTLQVIDLERVPVPQPALARL